MCIRRHTLFVPIRACTDVDSEPSYSVGELTDTDNSNASPNESYASDSEMQVQAARARGKGSRQDNLEDTCSHLNSLVQPLTCVRHSHSHTHRATAHIYTCTGVEGMFFITSPNAGHLAKLWKFALTAKPTQTRMRLLG